MFTPNPALFDRDVKLEFNLMGSDMIEFEFNQRIPGAGFKKIKSIVTSFSERALNFQIADFQTFRANSSITSRVGSNRNRKAYQMQARQDHQMVTLLTEARDILKAEHGMI